MLGALVDHKGIVTVGCVSGYDGAAHRLIVLGHLLYARDLAELLIFIFQIFIVCQLFLQLGNLILELDVFLIVLARVRIFAQKIRNGGRNHRGQLLKRRGDCTDNL